MSPSGAAIDPGEGNPSRIHAQRIQTSGFLFLAKWSNSNRLPVRCRTGIWRCLPGQVRRFPCSPEAFILLCSPPYIQFFFYI
ncbi:hypothetical protein BDA96_02G086000 [Sorghum bicolor]|uniref:Uncharacterized protein n=1 Tax=Sorghum bicolor TaxID=4558 RepID=A0A921RL81_SORBI|nr:hypothetical protein BDA96_02G086000 [Sorghum bicolor]KAG0542237.1 hypothetical protein BDA96_02G086000 [Sorghum bicolor]